VTFSVSDTRFLIERLAAGQPPPPRLAAKVIVGYDALLTPWGGDLGGYVASGGSLIRIVSAQAGTGKTHLARAVEARAASMGFLVCHIDAQAQHTDDDLSLYAAFCNGLRSPSSVLFDEINSGLVSILEGVAERMGGSELKLALRRAKLPLVVFEDILPGLVDEIRRVNAASGRIDSMVLGGIAVLGTLLSGERVFETRSLPKIRQTYSYPLLRRLSRLPGKRDAKLWLESLLRAIPAMGFKGVLIVLDEHDSLTRKILDQHIVQLRRILDKLTEGHLPGVFAVYFVLDNFSERVSECNAALDQRIKPILEGPVPHRILSSLEDHRGIGDFEFLQMLGEQIYSLVGPLPLTEKIAARVRECAVRNVTLGMVNTRQFVIEISNYLLDTVI